MALYVFDGSLMLKETKGLGDSVTVLKEETRRPYCSPGVLEPSSL